MPEYFANGDAATFLDGAITSGAGTLKVNEAAVLPSAPTFTIKVDSELMLVTAVSGATLTVTRAQEGTTAAAHEDSTRVDFLLTAAGLDRFRLDLGNAGAWASRPTDVAKDGQVYRATDGPYLSVSKGGIWYIFYPHPNLTPPILANLAWVNQGTATSDDSRGPVILTAAAAAADSCKILKAALPGSTYTIELGFFVDAAPADVWEAGIVLRESASGKLVTWCVAYVASENGFVADLLKWNSPTSFNATYSASGAAVIRAFNLNPGRRVRYLRIVTDSTNRRVYTSSDGILWLELTGLATTRTDFITPDEAGFFVNTTNSVAISATVFHFKVF